MLPILYLFVFILSIIRIKYITIYITIFIKYSYHVIYIYNIIFMKSNKKSLKVFSWFFSLFIYFKIYIYLIIYIYI